MKKAPQAYTPPGPSQTPTAEEVEDASGKTLIMEAEFLANLRKAGIPPELAAQKLLNAEIDSTGRPAPEWAQKVARAALENLRSAAIHPNLQRRSGTRGPHSVLSHGEP